MAQSGAAPRYLAITGGVGGAKLALGLSHVLSADEVAFVVNTGDDFEHLGFSISPDIDTLTYTFRWPTWPTARKAGVALTRPGLSWRRWSPSAAKPGSGSAIGIWRCTPFARQSLPLVAHSPR